MLPVGAVLLCTPPGVDDMVIDRTEGKRRRRCGLFGKLEVGQGRTSRLGDGIIGKREQVPVSDQQVKGSGAR